MWKFLLIPASITAALVLYVIIAVVKDVCNPKQDVPDSDPLHDEENQW